MTNLAAIEVIALIGLLVSILVYVFVDVCEQAEIHSRDDDAAGEEPA